MPTRLVYNPPPNWPAPPQGWTPPPGWEPDPAWGPAPHGWPLWVQESSSASGWVGRHKGASVAIGAVGAVFFISVVAAAAGSGADSKDGANAASRSFHGKHGAAHNRHAAEKLKHQSPQHTTRPATKRRVASAATAADANSWTMPDLRGTDLQTAQDTIQSITNDGIWFTDSHDATGQDRGQWFDRDWQVCDQSVAPGSSIEAGTDIDFGVVRRHVESCP